MYSSAFSFYDEDDLLLGTVELDLDALNSGQYLEWLNHYPTLGGDSVPLQYQLPVTTPYNEVSDAVILITITSGVLQLYFAGYHQPEPFAFAYIVLPYIDLIYSVATALPDVPTPAAPSWTISAGCAYEYIDYANLLFVPAFVSQSQGPVCSPINRTFAAFSPFYPGSFVSITVSPSMSGMCPPSINICLGDCFSYISIGSDSEGNQIITSLAGDLVVGTLFDNFQTMDLWFAFDAFRNVFVGINNDVYQTPFLTTIMISNYSTYAASISQISVSSSDSDWSFASDITWNPLVYACAG